MTHTPSPWTFVDAGEFVWVLADPNQNVICDIVGRKDNSKNKSLEITDEDIANARLIAAAPELLQAAQKALDECVDLIATEAGNALEDAIKKAKGN